MKNMIIATLALLALAACKDDSIKTTQSTADVCASEVVGFETAFVSLDQFEGSNKLDFIKCVRASVIGTAGQQSPSITISTNGL